MRESIDTRTRWLGLIAAASGTFLTALDITVNVALPDIAESFNTDAVTIQWIIIFYVGSSTAMQLGLGGAADVFGLKRMFMVGLVAYTASVVAIGLSENLGVVFGLRVFQSVGNGLLIALGPAIVTRLFPDDFRGRALGIMGGLGTLGMITGSLGGGFLVDEFGWRAIFLGRVPICLLAIGFSAALLRVPDEQGRESGFDLRGASILSIALAALILLLSLGGRFGWTEGYIPSSGGRIGGRNARVLGRRARDSQADPGAFAAAESGAGHRAAALAPGVRLNLRELVHPAVSGGGLARSQRERLGRAADAHDRYKRAVGAGWRVAVGPRQSGLYDHRLAGGVAGWLCCCWRCSTARSPVTEVAVGLLAVGIGTGLFQSSNANLIMGSVPVDRLGTGGGMIGLFRGLGTVFSVAIMGAVLSARESVHRDSADEGEAFVLAYQETYLIAAALAAGAVVVSLTLWPRWVNWKRCRS